MKPDTPGAAAACILRESADLHLQLIENHAERIAEMAQIITDCFRRGNKLLIFGNGGSAADAQHVAAEFVGRFVRERPPLPAIALTTDTSAITSIGNDFGFEQIFAKQVLALGNPGDAVLAISTSGRSPSILAGAKAAQERGLLTLGLTGGDGGLLADCVDCVLIVPSRITARIQECHLCVEHILCEMVEAALFDPPSPERQVNF